MVKFWTQHINVMFPMSKTNKPHYHCFDHPFSRTLRLGRTDFLCCECEKWFTKDQAESYKLLDQYKKDCIAIITYV